MISPQRMTRAETSSSSRLVKDIRRNLEDTFDAHSMLVVGMNEWHIKDYFFRKAGSHKLRIALLHMISYSDSALLKLGPYNKRRSERRVTNFLGQVIGVLDDLALLDAGVATEIKPVREYVEHYRARFPNPKSRISFSAASVSALIGIILLAR